MAKSAIYGKGMNKKYCAIITLDIKNAFNSAGWNQIMQSIKNLEVPDYLIRIIGDYFTDRILCYETDIGVQHYKTSSGVPQGSVLGPLLWNIMYNGVLELNIPEEASIIGFADDIAIVVRARFLDEVEMYANDAIRTIKVWLRKAGLELADHKTEAVLISNRRKKETITIKIGASEIKSVAAIKYLGVMIDERLNYKTHLKYSCEKATTVNNALSRIMPNVGGPRQSRRILLSRVTMSVLLYGASIWAKSIRSTSRKDQMSLFRQCCLRVCSGYRTTSLEAISVIAGIIPIDMAAEELHRLYAAKEHNDTENTRMRKILERNETMRNWQERWENSQKGRWTYRLIPVIKKWVERKHGEVNYHLTQFLTGHGGYRCYLYKFGHDDSPHCPTCEEPEDAEHVVFKCRRFDGHRREVEVGVGHDINPGNIIDIMITSPEKWELISNYITDINLLLQLEEKSRKEQRRNALNVEIA